MIRTTRRRTGPLAAPSQTAVMETTMPAPGAEAPASGFGAALQTGPFRALWLAQVCAQMAQNLTWITLGAYVAETASAGKNTLVAAITVSALLAQLLLSGVAGVLVGHAANKWD